MLTLCMTNFVLKRLGSKSGRQRGAMPVQVAFTKDVFPFLDRMVLFLSSKGLSVFCFFLFYQGLSSAFDFSPSRDFSKSIELTRLNFFKCAMSTKYANNMKNDSLSEAVPSPR